MFCKPAALSILGFRLDTVSNLKPYGDHKVANTSDIRNIVLLGHGGCGKTSLTEAILRKTGAINRLGSVDDKCTVCDFYEEEKEHSHSISSAITHTAHVGKTINIIDTPGYPDFVGPAIKSIPAAETSLIVISASSGIETNTRRLFELATKSGLSRIIVINKVDADNVDLAELLGNISETFGPQCRPANLPAADKKSVIDCIENESGDSAVGDVASAHTDLIESVIEADDALITIAVDTSGKEPKTGGLWFDHPALVK